MAGLDLISGQVAVAEAERYAAESELADRQANCGSIARAPDICPTGAELADFRAAVAAIKKAEEDKKPDRPGGGQGQGQGGGTGDG